MADDEVHLLVKLIANCFNNQYSSLGVTLEPNGTYANQGFFMGHTKVYPSIDVSRRSRVDVSIFFRDPNSYGATITSLHEAATEAFPENKVFYRERNRGQAVCVAIVGGAALGLNEGLVQQAAAALSGLVGLAGPLFSTMLATESSSRNPSWSRDELILALELYVQTSPSLPGPRTEAVIHLSQTLNRLHARLGTLASGTLRNPNGVAMKLQNFRRFEPRDEGHAPAGLKAGNRLEEEVWETFQREPAKLRSVANAIRTEIDAGADGNLGEDAEALLSGVDEAPEGRVLTVIHLRRERSSRLVQSKKKRVLKTEGRLACECCNFDFKKIYGERGSSFIECHHTKPVATLMNDAVTHLDDLALLCSNCHRMIHVKQPWLAIKDLQKLVGSTRSDDS